MASYKNCIEFCEDCNTEHEFPPGTLPPMRKLVKTMPRVPRTTLYRLIERLDKHRMLVEQEPDKKCKRIRLNFPQFTEICPQEADTEQAHTEYQLEFSPITKNKKDIYRSNYTPGFENFFKAFPKHESKLSGQKAWNKLNLKEQQLALLDIQKRNLESSWSEDKKFIPLVGTYLNGKRWEDETAKKPADRRKYGIFPGDK